MTFFPDHDKFTLRFFYNLGHEFLKYIQNTYGMDQLLGLLDGGNSYAAADVMESDRADAGYNQLTTDFQQLNFYGKDSENGNLNKVYLAYLFLSRASAKFPITLF